MSNAEIDYKSYSAKIYKLLTDLELAEQADAIKTKFPELEESTFLEFCAEESLVLNDYIDARVEAIEGGGQKKSAFSSLTKMDLVVKCCYQRAKEAFYSRPKHQILLGDQIYPRTDALDIFVELDLYLRAVDGRNLTEAQDERCWPLISECLNSGGFRAGYGRGPRTPWSGGGRSAAEGQKSTSAQKSSGGRGR